jgi:hypothetical protein
MILHLPDVRLHRQSVIAALTAAVQGMPPPTATFGDLGPRHRDDRPSVLDDQKERSCVLL